MSGWVLAGAVLAVGLVAPVPKGKNRPTEAEVRQQLAGFWDVVNPPAGSSVQWFFDDGQATELTSGVESLASVGGYRLNVIREPVWLDLYIRDNGRCVVVPGIIKFDGETLVWVVGEGQPVGEPVWEKRTANPPGRPTTFESKKPGDGVRRTLRKAK